MDDEAEISMVARRFLGAVGGDDDAVEALADLALAPDWVAGWALQVAVELRVSAAAASGDLPSLGGDAERQLEQLVSRLVEGRR